MGQLPTPPTTPQQRWRNMIDHRIVKDPMINHPLAAERPGTPPSDPISFDGRPVHLQDLGSESDPPGRPAASGALIIGSLMSDGGSLLMRPERHNFSRETFS